MDKNSNAYTFIFAIVMVIVVAAGLSFAATSLQPLQAENVRQEKMQDILSTIGINVERAEAEELFNENIKKQISLNHKGEEKDDVNAFDVNLARELKKPVEEQTFPIYIAEKDGDTFYVIPLRGVGLWDAIWGYVALKEDVNTIEGVTFDHKGETAGLGAEITNDWFKERFEDEHIYNDKNELVGVKVTKGYSANQKGDNKVSAISGATITGDGVSDMFEERLKKYKPFFDEIKNNKEAIQ
ncbi:MAG: NADH:ubiquinone reductase (Na(+)-transporting) subunit C [Bacteroidota bacterium]